MCDNVKTELLASLRNVRHTLRFAIDTPKGDINDTLWMMYSQQTIFDFIDEVLEQHGGSASVAPVQDERHDFETPAQLSAYDPNIRRAKQRVRLTLRQWDYTATLEATVGGNCQGFEIFDIAISNAFETLPARTYALIKDPVAYIVLTNAAGDTLECKDDELRCEDWLAKMVAEMKIINQEPDTAAPTQEADK